MANSRPITTEYAGADRLAHATTKERAVRAAAIRLIKGDYSRAVVMDGKRKVATLHRFAWGLNVTFTRNWK